MRHQPEHHPELIAFVEKILGPGGSIADRSRAYGRASVMWQIHADGGPFWLKQHEMAVLYQRELAALARYAALVDGIEVPAIVASDDGLGAMLLTHVEGSHPDESDLSPDELSDV